MAGTFSAPPDDDQSGGAETGKRAEPSINMDGASETRKATAQHTGGPSAGVDATAPDAGAGMAGTGENETTLPDGSVGGQARGAKD